MLRIGYNPPTRPTIDSDMHPVFEKLHPAIQRALAKCNFTEPQIKAVPVVFSGLLFFTLVNLHTRRYHFKIAYSFTDLFVILMEIRVPHQ